jgi:PTS system nitrogen regulatory IIA component
MTIGDLLEPGAVTLRVSAANKRQVLGVIADVAARVSASTPTRRWKA